MIIHRYAFLKREEKYQFSLSLERLHLGLLIRTGKRSESNITMLSGDVDIQIYVFFGKRKNMQIQVHVGLLWW